MTEAAQTEDVDRRSKPRSETIEHDSVATITHPVISVVGADTTVDEVARFLLEHRVTYAAVRSVEGDILGIVSMTDLVREHVLEGNMRDEAFRTSDTPSSRRPEGGLHIEPVQRTLARDIMMPFVFMMSMRASIAQAAAVMAARGVQQLVVVSKKDVVGIVEARDVLRALARRLGVFVPDDVDEPWRTSCENAL
jgi:predicted transcriptional regulator